MLGNLSVDEIESRTGISFPDDIKAFMKENHQDSASGIAKGKWHCFDLPFHIVCGDMETAQKIYNSVKEKASEVKEPLAFSIQSQQEKKA
jgi:hypothetical protein